VSSNALTTCSLLDFFLVGIQLLFRVHSFWGVFSTTDLLLAGACTVIQRTCPKSYAQAVAEVRVTRQFLYNFSGDQVLLNQLL
jgi:hypothetical protein